MIVRILLWGIAGDGLGVDELRDRLPELETPSTWLWNEATERFGAVVVGGDHEDEAAAALAEARTLLGREPDLYEEFDALSG